MVKAKEKKPARISMGRLRACVQTALLISLLISLLGGFPAAALGQTGNLFIFSVKGGQLDTSTSGDTFIEFLETTEGHGALQTSRQEDTINFEQDIYAISSSGMGLGVGLEILSYEKQHVFQDGETLNIVV